MADVQEFRVVKRHWGEKNGKRHRFRRGSKRVGDPEDPNIRGHLKWGNLVPWDDSTAQEGETDQAEDGED